MAEEQNSDNLPKLTGKQEAFVNAYFECDFNATAAARRAGYKGNDATLAQVGYENLRKPDIDSHIRARMDEQAMSANETLHRIAAYARADFADLIDDNGNPDIKEARKLGRARLIKRIKQRAITTEQSDIVETEIEIVDPLKALELLGKHHKLFTERHELTGVDGGAIPILITGMDVNEL